LVITAKTPGFDDWLLDSITIKEKVSALTAVGNARAVNSGSRNLLKIKS